MSANEAGHTPGQFAFRDSLALIPTPVEELIGRTITLGEDIDIPVHPLDTEPMARLHTRLLMLYQNELDVQSWNRQQMSIDAAFYDGKQWSEEDIRELERRGQVPIVFNQVKPVINWLAGNELRNRTDFKVVGRGPEDAKPAEIKTALLKYIGDVNAMSLHQSLAYRDAVKVGIGWNEDGVQYGDDGEELYSRHVPWREVLHDSKSRQHDLKDARYIFRHGYYDIDMVVSGFGLDESRYSKVLAVKPGYSVSSNRDDVLDAMENTGDILSHSYNASNGTAVRERILLIEAWYRVPEQINEFRGGDFHRQRFDKANPAHQEALRTGNGAMVQRMRQSMRVAIFSEGGLLYEGASPYAHNAFPYTAVWCFRDDESGLPYGLIRDLRDLQYDVNKRASKSLYILSTNKVVMDKGAVDDLDEFAEEIARPDAVIEKNKGYELVLNVDRELAPAHLDMMRMNMQQIQSSSGVTDEQLGRSTNAVSGAAITARQDQGALQTASIFDMLRYFRLWQGQKVLSNIEQFMSEQKVIRITNAKGREEFLRLNDPNLPESVLASTQADFIITDTPQSASTRLAQSEQLGNLIQKMPPEIGAMFLPTMVDLMDIPNKDEFIKLMRSKLGIPDPDAEQTPEQLAQQQEAQRQQQMQAAMQQLQLEKIRNEAAKLQADTALTEAKTVRERVAAMGDAVQAAATATQAAPIAATADDMLASAGFAEANTGAGLSPAPMPPQPQPIQPDAPAMPPDAAMPQGAM